MQITEHFSSEEFNQPARHGFSEIVYPEKYLPFLFDLCAQLEIIRAQFNRPVTILSGYRSVSYNKAIGGARNSQHVLGKAVDIAISEVKASDVHRKIVELHNSGRIKIGGLGKYPGFVHVDVRPGHLVTWGGN